MRRQKTTAYLLAAGSVMLVGVLLTRERFPEWDDFAIWVLLLAAAELLPVSLGFTSQLTLTFPIHLALALLYPPGVAMLIAGITALDRREIRGELPLWRIVFNRAQIMLAVGAAAAVHSLAPGTGPNALWVVPSALALVVTNLGLVAVVISLDTNVPLKEVVEILVPRPARGFVATTGLFTALGAGGAFVFNEPYGPLFILSLFIPLITTRLATIWAREKLELSERVQAQQQALLRATESVFEEREAERHRIAEEIHDSSLQYLAAASYGCGNALAFMRQENYEPATRALTTAQEALDMAMDELRNSLKDLRRSSLEAGGLMETIRKNADEINTLWGPEVRVQSSVMSEPPLSVSLVASQILQEALVNAAKHGGAGVIDVGVHETDAELHVIVQDDGVGFDAKQKIGEEHHGMRLMGERAEQVGGRLIVTSEVGKGTRIEAILPAGLAS